MFLLFDRFIVVNYFIYLWNVAYAQCFDLCNSTNIFFVALQKIEFKPSKEISCLCIVSFNIVYKIMPSMFFLQIVLEMSDTYDLQHCDSFSLWYILLMSEFVVLPLILPKIDVFDYQDWNIKKKLRTYRNCSS